MQIQTEATIISDFKGESTKDREYHLKCYRLKRAIQKINKINIDIVMGRLYLDNDSSAVIDGLRWS